MFNATTVIIDAFVRELVSRYVTTLGEDRPEIELISANARNALEIIANSDAPYHDINHTIMVTMVGTEILRGKILMEGSVTKHEWVHFVISLLNHDIGYVRGICRGDKDGRYITSIKNETIEPPAGSTDAALTPYHVDRAKLFIKERFEKDDRIDETMICEYIERTRFPLPNAEDHLGTADFPGLLRAADLIGQLGDPQYHRKISALFQEFQETNQAEKMGYRNAAELREGYPQFFWKMVAPYIKDGIMFLRRTQEGQKWVAHLYANVFSVEHTAPAYGPERQVENDRGIDRKSISEDLVGENHLGSMTAEAQENSL